MEKTDIKSLNLEELTAFVESLGEKKFRAKQIYEWIHRKHVASFSEMTNISAALIEQHSRDIEKELRTNKALSEYLDEDTRKLLSNRTPYIAKRCSTERLACFM